MDDRVETADSGGRRALTRVQALPWLLFILSLALAAWLTKEAFWADDTGDALGTTVEALQQQNRLTVFSAQLAPVVSAQDSRLLGLVESRQVAVIPARVDYTIDLSKVGHNRLSWDEGSRTLDVLLPPLEVSKPNLDEAHAQYLREGIWISRDAQDSLDRNNTRLAEQQATRQATAPVLMDLARQAARNAVRQNLAIPLRVAGFENVTVNVRFDGEDGGA